MIYNNYAHFQAPLLGLFGLVPNCINSGMAAVLDSVSSFSICFKKDVFAAKTSTMTAGFFQWFF